MTRRLFPLVFDTKDISLESLTDYANGLCEQQRDNNWQLGDAVRAAKRDLGTENWSQAFPEWYSVGHLERCEAVALAYPRREDRNLEATWSIHRDNSNSPDRIALVQAHVNAGHTSDEASAAKRAEKSMLKATARAEADKANNPDLFKEKSESTSEKRWLLACDVGYFLHKFWFSGAGVEAADGVASWIERTVERLRGKNLTDVACCFDSKTNHRKALTEGWEDRYKDRPKKDPELGQQLELVHELLEGKGFACVSIDGMEGDDVLASFSKQFPDRVSLLSPDKDLRSCLSPTCNVLVDATWKEDDSGDMLANYLWYTAVPHERLRCRNLLYDTGLWDVPSKDKPQLGLSLSSEDWALILSEESQDNAPVFIEGSGLSPDGWLTMQTLMGDATDGVKGAVGVGEVLSAELVRTFGTVEACIAAAKDDNPSIKPAKRKSLIEFEPKLEITRQLVTLRTDLELPENTRI